MQRRGNPNSKTTIKNYENGSSIENYDYNSYNDKGVRGENFNYSKVQINKQPKDRSYTNVEINGENHSYNKMRINGSRPTYISHQDHSYTNVKLTSQSRRRVEVTTENYTISHTEVKGKHNYSVTEESRYSDTKSVPKSDIPWRLKK